MPSATTTTSTFDVNFDAPSKKVTSPTKLAHVVLRTANFPAMHSFYLTFLGATDTFANDEVAFMTYDSEHHRIALISNPKLRPKDLKTSGLEHIAFTFPTLSNLLLAYRERKAHGITPVFCVNHGPTISIYYRDPDGNMLETQVDVFETMEEADAFVKTKQFAENPIGVDIDPEKFIKRLKSGESEKEVMKQPYIGPREMPDFDAMW